MTRETLVEGLDPLTVGEEEVDDDCGELFYSRATQPIQGIAARPTDSMWKGPSREFASEARTWLASRGLRTTSKFRDMGLRARPRLYGRPTTRPMLREICTQAYPAGRRPPATTLGAALFQR